MTETISIPFEVPKSNFTELLSDFTKKALVKENWSLYCEDLELTPDEVSGTAGLLPLIMWISGKTLAPIWGEQKLVFRCDSEALCGVVLELNQPILPQSIWLHAIHYQIENVVKNSPGPAVIDEWFAKWNEALSKRELSLLPPATPKTSNMQG